MVIHDWLMAPLQPLRFWRMCQVICKRDGGLHADFALLCCRLWRPLWWWWPRCLRCCVTKITFLPEQMDISLTCTSSRAHMFGCHQQPKPPHPFNCLYNYTSCNRTQSPPVCGGWSGGLGSRSMRVMERAYSVHIHKYTFMKICWVGTHKLGTLNYIWRKPIQGSGLAAVLALVNLYIRAWYFYGIPCRYNCMNNVQPKYAFFKLEFNLGLQLTCIGCTIRSITMVWILLYWVHFTGSRHPN